MAIKPAGYGGATIGPGAPSIKKIVVPKSTVIPNAAKTPIGSIKGTIGTVPGYASDINKFVPTPSTAAALTGLGGTTANLPSTLGKLTTTPQGISQAAAGGDANAQSALGVPFNFGAYLDEIENDPVYKSALSTYNTGQQSWRRQLATSIGNAVTQGGWDIQGALSKDPTLQGYASDVTPEVAAAAAANQLSTRAQLEKQFNQNIAAQAYKNAASGTLGSGAQAVGATNITDANVLASNQAQNQLLEALRGNVGSYLDRQTSGLQTLDQTRADVAARLAAQEGATYGVNAYTQEGADEGNVDVTSDTGTSTGVPSAASTLGGAGVKWGGQTFTNLQQARDYFNRPEIRKKGVTFNQWAQNHGDALQRLLLGG